MLWSFYFFRCGNEAPVRTEFVFKWVNTSAQITRIQLWSGSNSDTWDSGTVINVWGADDDVISYTYPNLSNGAIFEESDTGKHYMFDGDQTWNEVS